MDNGLIIAGSPVVLTGLSVKGFEKSTEKLVGFAIPFFIPCPDNVIAISSHL